MILNILNIILWIAVAIIWSIPFELHSIIIILAAAMITVSQVQLILIQQAKK